MARLLKDNFFVRKTVLYHSSDALWTQVEGKKEAKVLALNVRWLMKNKQQMWSTVYSDAVSPVEEREHFIASSIVYRYDELAVKLNSLQGLNNFNQFARV